MGTGVTIAWNNLKNIHLKKRLKLKWMILFYQTTQCKQLVVWSSRWLFGVPGGRPACLCCF